MAIFFPPVPPVMTGGAQPYGQKKNNPVLIEIPVNNPPFRQGGPYAINAEIIGLNQPNPWVYTFFGALQPFSPVRGNPNNIGIPVDQPPYRYGGPNTLMYEIISVTQPNPWTYTYFGAWQPFQPKNLNPSITAVPEDNPPFNYGGPYATKSEIVDNTQPNPWTYTYFGAGQPFLPKKLSPSIPGQSVDPPPFSHRGRTTISLEIVAINQPDPWTYNFPGGAQPFQPRRLPIAVTNVPSDNPPFTQRTAQLFAELASLNQPDPWTYKFMGGSGPYMSRPLSPFAEASGSYYKIYIIL